MEVHDIVQEAVVKIIPKEKKYKRAKWLSEEGLQIAEKRREVKGKGEKESYTHLNADFQRIARRDKKAFLSVQCKEIEENNRMGNTRDFFKKIRDTKGICHSKTGSIKDRNGMDLAEAEAIKRADKNTQKSMKKDLHNTCNHDGVITHLEPDILECEVKWALGSPLRGDEIPSLIKMVLLKCWTQYASKFGKFCSGHRTRKAQFSFQC